MGRVERISRLREWTRRRGNADGAETEMGRPTPPRAVVVITALMVVVLLLLSATMRGGGVEARCGGTRPGGANRLDAADMTTRFSELVERRKLVGQQDALQAVVEELGRFSERATVHVPALIHFVGPSGTGKTTMAEMVAESVFSRNVSKCSPQLASRFGALAESACLLVAQRSVAIENACGIVKFKMELFHQQDPAEAANFIREVFQAVADELEHVGHDKGVVLFVDDFNHCVGPCVVAMERALRESKIVTSAGRAVSLDTSLVVLTSDLSDEGLDLVPGEPRASAREKVLAKARARWGEFSLWASRPLIVPVLPFSESEMDQLVDLMMASLERTARDMVRRAMAEFAKKTTGEPRWSGKLTWTPATKAVIRRHVTEESGKINARAFFDLLKPALMSSLRDPVDMGKRLVACYAPLEHKDTSWGASVRSRVGDKQAKILEWTTFVTLVADVSSTNLLRFHLEFSGEPTSNCPASFSASGSESESRSRASQACSGSSAESCSA